MFLPYTTTLGTSLVTWTITTVFSIVLTTRHGLGSMCVFKFMLKRPSHILASEIPYSHYRYKTCSWLEDSCIWSAVLSALTFKKC